MTTPRLDFAFIGCGRAARFHAEVVHALGHRLVAASARRGSPNIAGFCEAFGVTRAYDDWRRLLACERPDAVVIATPWDATQALVTEIVRRGVPCLVEKPVALDVKTLEEILAEIGPFTERVLVGYNRRFYESVTPLRSALGRWPLVSIALDLPEATRVLRGRYAPEIVRHILSYMSSHWFDLLRSLIGDVEIVDVYARRTAGVDHPTAYNGLLWSKRFRVPIHLQSNFDAPDRISIAFNFDDRIYRLCPVETLTVYRGMQREPSADGRLNRYVPGVEDVVHADATYKPGFCRQMENFVTTCVLRTAPNTDGCTLEDALTVTRFLEEIQGQSRDY